MGMLYLSNEGSRISKDGNMLIIYNGDDEPIRLPLEKVHGLVVFPGVHLSEAITIYFLEQGKSVTYLSSRGKYYGRLEPIQSVNVQRQLLQVERMHNPAFCLYISKEYISTKIHNSVVVLKEVMRHHNAAFDVELQKMVRLEHRVLSAESIEELLGYEGMAAKISFACMAQLVSPEFHFTGRTRNPPRDPFNSMLSFGYTLLLYDFYTLFSLHGLHPYFAFLHKPRNGHPALASDLMEEWRPILVDAFVMHLANRGTFHVEDFSFDAETEGVYLGKEQSKVFVGRYEARVKRPLVSPEGEEEFNYRIRLEHQVELLAKAIDEGDPSIYKGFRLR